MVDLRVNFKATFRDRENGIKVEMTLFGWHYNDIEHTASKLARVLNLDLESVDRMPE